MRYFQYVFMIVFLLLAALAEPGRCGESEKSLELESVFVRDMPLRAFAELITRGCSPEWKVLVSEGAAAKTINFYLNNSGVEETLRAVCGSYGLWYKRNPGSRIVQIMTLEEFRRGVNLYAEETVEVLTIRYPAAEEIGDTLARLFQDRVVWNRPVPGDNDPKDQIDRALDRLDTIADRATMVTNQDGSSSSSRNRDDNYDDDDDDRDRNTRTATVTDPASIIERQSRTIEALRANMGDASSREGVTGDAMPGHVSARPGLVYVSSAPAANALIFRSSDPASLARVKQIAQDLDKPKPQVLLEVKVLDVMLDDEHARGVDWLFRSGPGDDRNRVTGGWSRGITQMPGQSIESSSPALSLIPQGAGLDSRAVVFSVVTEDIRARLQLLQDNDRITSLATPNLLVADNEASRVFVGEEEVRERRVTRVTNRNDDGNITDTVDEIDNTYERIGTTLLITPRIHADRTVTIRILQEETTLGQENPTNNGGFTRPVGERSVVTTVIAKDGNTIAIGGLIREIAGKRETGVPGLMKLPVVGNIFKKTTETRERHELLVLIRPYILLAPGEGEEASRELLERISRHPAADVALPDLGVGKREEMPVGKEKQQGLRPDLIPGIPPWDEEQAAP